MLFKGNSSSLQLIIEKLQFSKEHSHSNDTLGTEGGSSWVSEDHTTSPGSSCATPNSTTEGPDCELSFTVGVTDGTPHACRFCDKAFPKQSYLKKHEQTHADCMPFRCEYCRRLFKHKRSRDRHIKLHTGDRKYKCTQCDAAFSRSDHLKIHMKTHDHQKPFQCTVCNRGYNTAAALTSHMQNHKRSSENNSNPAPPGTTFKCLQCSEIFRKPEELQNHMNSHQPSDTTSNSSSRSKPSSYPTVRLTCTYCTKDNFATIEALTSHVQSVHKSIINGDLQPDLTNNNQQKSSSSAAVPISTMGTLSSSSPNQLSSSLPSYYCELCTMRFTSLQALHKHTTTMHGLSTNTYDSLKYLMMPEFINNGQLSCVYCAMHFLTPASFAEHYVIFHGPYPPHLLGFPPPEQLKPTDLSVGRKPSPIKRSMSADEHMSPKKKFNKTMKDTSLRSNNHRFDYGDPLICNQCMAAFTDFASFRAHIKLHIEVASGGGGDLLGGGTPPPSECKRTPLEFTCPHCRSVFSSSEEISQHVVAHFLATSTAYSCETCQKPFHKTDELQKHLMDAHAQFLYSCSICNEVFESKATIQVHFASRHSNEEKVYRCTGCPTSKNVYHSELEFATHVKSIHTSNESRLAPLSLNTHHDSPAMTCVVCHMSFSSELNMQLHLATHGKQFQCTVCPQSFHIEYLLDKHMQTHHSLTMNGNRDQDSGAKDYSPRQSPASRLGNPIMKMENGEARDNFVLSCDMCEKSEFSNEGNLMTHRKLYHNKPPSPARLQKDSIEGGDDRTRQSQKPRTNSPHDRTKNLDAFNGDSNFNNNASSCEICEKRDFANEAELQLHRKLTHHAKLSSPGKAMLHCAYCNETCKSRNELEKHMKSHSQYSTTTTTTPGTHKCIICDEMCATAAILAEHKLTHCKVLAGKACMHCKGSITTEEQFYSHIQQHSSASCNSTTTSTQLILPTVCVICRQTLVSEVEARMHARFHTHQSADLISCSVCCRMSQRQDLIAGICRKCYHQRGNKSSSPFRCPECGIKFDSGPAIEIHLATVHRKNYQCIRCQVSFDNEKEIQHHVATHLMSNGLNGSECRLCRLVLPSPLQLQTHLIEHTFAGCTAFTCYLCQSVFTTAKGLQTHILDHGLSARPYDCTRCKQKFFFTSELEHHTFMHLEEMAIHEGQNYYYQDKAALKEKSPIPYPTQSSKVSSDASFNSEASSKYNNCSDRKIVEVENGVSSIDIKVESKSQSDECESEDEQIDVVTTKVEDTAVEQTDKAE